MRSLIIGLTAMLAACSSQSNEPSAFEQAQSLFTQDELVTNRFAAIAQTPRPILQVGLIDAGTSGNMLLEARDGRYERYLSPDASSIILEDGFLHSMFGFGEGLMGVEISENRALVFSGRNGWADRIHTYLGGDDRTTFRTYRCAIANQGSDEVALLRGTITTRRMAEACRNAEHNFVNLYWIDESRGEIVQSRQWAGPNLGAVSTRRAGVPQ